MSPVVTVEYREPWWVVLRNGRVVDRAFTRWGAMRAARKFVVTTVRPR